MTDLLRELSQTPLPTMLVMAGILFLLLAVVGKFGTRIVINPQRQGLALLLGAILLGGGVAMYILRAPSTSKEQSAPVPTPALSTSKEQSAPVPTPAPPPRLTPELLASKQWEFRHGEGDVISPQVELHQDGTIGGIDHPNESRWGLEDGTLVFYHASGAPSTRFDSVRLEDGRIIASGRLLLAEDEAVVMHVLEEL